MQLSDHTKFHKGQRVRFRDDGDEALIESVAFGQTKPQSSGAEHVFYYIDFDGNGKGDYYYASQLDEVTCNELMQRYHNKVHVGDRVEIAPHLALWMQGVKYGKVVETTSSSGQFVNVKMDKNHKVYRFYTPHLTRIE